MYRTALRSTPCALRAVRTSPSLTSTSRRFLTTAPADKRRTWKGTAARWGLAIAAVYWYNTSPIFADEPVSQTIPPPSQFSDADVPTVEAVIEQKRRETRASPAVAPSAHAATPTPEATSEKTTSATPSEAQPGFQEGSPEALEEEAGQQGAFNPETGEINWDCPCLGGMADGPCGEDFKAAFSCFVFSESEPKGMDCIDKFQHMQDCFRKYPEIYGAELQDDEEDDSPAPVAGAEGAGPGDVQPESPKETGVEIAQKAERQHAVETPSKTEETVQEPRKADVKKDEHPGVPTAAVDATAANEGETTEVPVSYAEIAAKGPKQTPEEAAAPQPPQVEVSESTSTSSLIDVDAPSVHTVPSDFMEQDVKTETQAERREREEEAQKLADKARAEADLAKKKASRKAHKADNWLTQQFASMSDGASSALVVANFLAVVGLSGYLGYKAWGLYERGRFSWKHAGVGLGVLGVVGAFEGVFTNYLQKGKGKKQ